MAFPPHESQLSFPFMGEQKAADLQPIDRDPTAEKEDKEVFDRRNKEADLKSKTQDIKERKLYANRSFRLTTNWVCFLVVTTIIQQIMGIWHVGLTEKEFIAVVTTTTASIFGFWWLVGKYLFHK